MRRPSNPLTALGLLALALAVVGYVVGWWLGWIELTVLATACALALVVAIPFVIGRLHLDVERRLEHDRIVVGERGQAVFEFRNPRSTPARGRDLHDLIADSDGTWDGQRTVKVPALAGGSTATRSYELPAFARGCYHVGPAVISRADPLQLMRRNVSHTGHDTLWVHPRHEAVAALPVGFAKDLEGPTSDTSPVGDVAFHSLREYEPGDDFRHIHWMSTARANRPMVRHYVDNRRPHLAVLLDVRGEEFGPDEFEVGVEIAATLAVSSFLHREPIAIWAGPEVVLGRGSPGDRDQVLDRLSLVRRGRDGRDEADLDAVASEMLRNEPGVSAVALVTGPMPSAALLGVVGQLRRKVRVIVVRVWPSRAVRHEPVPGAHALDVDSLDGFVGAWLGLTR